MPTWALIGEIYTPVDRDPADRRPLHDGPAPGRLRGAPDRGARDRARPLRHVRAADRHAGGAARRAGAHRRQRDGARGAARARSCEPSRDVLDRRLRRRSARQLGVAVASKFLAVGAVVPWLEAEVGAIATQALANTRYGPDGLALLRDGRERARGARRRCWPPTRAATTARPASSTRAAARRRTRAELHGLGGRPHRPRLRRPGQHPHGPRRRRRDGGGLRGEQRRARRAAAAGARRRRRRRRRPARPAVRRDRRRRARGAATAATTTTWSTCASTTTRTRSESCAASTTSTCC